MAMKIKKTLYGTLDTQSSMNQKKKKNYIFSIPSFAFFSFAILVLLIFLEPSFSVLAGTLLTVHTVAHIYPVSYNKEAQCLLGCFPSQELGKANKN